MKTVWIYVETSKQVGDATISSLRGPDAADDWFAEHDPDGVAFEYAVLTA